jgi:transcriptional regulator with XRE-family HTH domain
MCVALSDTRPHPHAASSATLDMTINSHIGQRLRGLRRSKKLTLQHVAGAVGVSFQQIQKYERGVDGISAARLWRVARAVGAKIDYFYEGLD